MSSGPGSKGSRPPGCRRAAAAHWPEVHPELERRKFPTDFYYQCLYNVSKSNDYSAAEREKAMATITALEKPVIAYKILAAGRLSASEGFEYAFNRIAGKTASAWGSTLKGPSTKSGRMPPTPIL